MSYLTYNPATNRYPVRGFSNPNAVQSPSAALPSYLHWRIEYNGMLSELQFSDVTSRKTFTSDNGVTSFTAISGIGQASPNFQALSDNVLGTGNNQYIGSGSSDYCIIRASFGAPVGIYSLWFYGQGSSSALFNCPGTIRLRASNDNITYTLIREWQISTTGLHIPSTGFTAQGLTQNVLKELLLY